MIASRRRKVDTEDQLSPCARSARGAQEPSHVSLESLSPRHSADLLHPQLDLGGSSFRVIADPPMMSPQQHQVKRPHSLSPVSTPNLSPRPSLKGSRSSDGLNLDPPTLAFPAPLAQAPELSLPDLPNPLNRPHSFIDLRETSLSPRLPPIRPSSVSEPSHCLSCS